MKDYFAVFLPNKCNVLLPSLSKTAKWHLPVQFCLGTLTLGDKQSVGKFFRMPFSPQSQSSVLIIAEASPSLDSLSLA